MCVLICSTSFVYCLLFLSDFNETWIFSTDFRKISTFQIQFSSSHKSRFIPCGRADEQTDEYEEANIRLSQFANAPKIRDVAKSVSWKLEDQ
jgi:hypothetical protein